MKQITRIQFTDTGDHTEPASALWAETMDPPGVLVLKDSTGKVIVTVTQNPDNTYTVTGS